MSTHDVHPPPHPSTRPGPDAVQRRAQRAGAGSVVLALAALPVSFVAFVVAMFVFGDQPSWETSAAAAQTAAAAVCCGIGCYLGLWATRSGARTLGSWGVAANLLVGLLVLLVAWVPVTRDDPAAPRPTIVNDTSAELLIYHGTSMDDPWVELGPGESITVDNAPLSTTGCIPQGMTARDTMGGEYETIERLCAGDVWRITGQAR